MPASLIADYLGWAESTVRQTIHRWNKSGLAGLWEARGRGKKPRWTQEDWQLLKQWLDEPRSISSRQLSQSKLRERQVVLGAEQVRRILKKRCDPAEVSSARERAPRQKLALEKTKTNTAESQK